MAATELLQFAAALVAVMALIGLSALAARRFGLAQGARRGSARRLAIVEVMPLDPRRRLLLVRCDDVEHLLLLGPAGETELRAGHARPLADRPIRTGSPEQESAVP